MNMEIQRTHRDVSAKSMGYTLKPRKERHKYDKYNGKSVLTDFDMYDQDEAVQYITVCLFTVSRKRSTELILHLRKRKSTSRRERYVGRTHREDTSLNEL